MKIRDLIKWPEKRRYDRAGFFTGTECGQYNQGIEACIESAEGEIELDVKKTERIIFEVIGFEKLDMKQRFDVANSISENIDKILKVKASNKEFSGYMTETPNEEPR